MRAMPLTCVVAVFLCAACGGRQDPQMVLYEAETSDRAVTRCQDEIGRARWRPAILGQHLVN